MRRLPRRRAGEHERRGGALSSLQCRARTPGRSRRADQYLPHTAAAIDAAALRKQGVARTRGLCGTAIARHADRNRGRRAHQALPASRPRIVHPAPRAAQSLLCAVPRRQLGPEARRRRNPAGPPDRLSALSPRMANARIAAAAAAQLPVRNARHLLSLGRTRIRRSRTLSDVARLRHAGRDTGGAAVASAATSFHLGPRQAHRRRSSPRADASRLRAVKVVLRRRTPDAGLARGPPLGPLRRVAVPRARFEIAELLVLHLVELAEELDNLLILVAMVSGDVVSRTVPQRTPDDRNLFLTHDLA